MFMATTFTNSRPILARAAVAGAIAAVSLTISTIPASADPATSGAVGTEIRHDGWDDPPGFQSNGHGHGNDWWGNDWGKDWWGDHDRGRGNDPLWRLFHNLIPGGVFGSS
ncbi:hypothetical protein [Nocardia sp. NBC_00403]|uniref:hypothetical protein n=1 Tax=Nocardia sp. NBC_00403 TaxID=2975990 RepID=UPI002E22E14A